MQLTPKYTTYYSLVNMQREGGRRREGGREGGREREGEIGRASCRERV